MHFNEKLDLALESLGIRNVDLAEAIGVDASLISKLRTGKRNRPAKPQQMETLCKAIAKLHPNAPSHDALPSKLRARMPESLPWSRGFACVLLAWFEEDGEPSAPSAAGPSSPRVFGEKLSALLDITGVTNVQIARALNVDSSLISLYRNGARVPTARSVTVDDISSFFARQTLSDQQSRVLNETVGYDGDGSDRTSLQSCISAWLSTASKVPTDLDSVESFLEHMDSFGNFAAGKSVIPLDSIAERAGKGDEPVVLFGHEGIQQAAVTYLAHVASQPTPRTLHHFSDQATEWMLGDPEYAKVWASLMVHVLSRGNRLRIIHTVNRDSAELFSAMENWIPLYMIGEIEPYYFRIGASGRFRTSHFLAEDLALIFGSCAPGMEDRSVYRYETDPRVTASAKEQFEGLLSQCSELMKVYKGKKDSESFGIHMDAFWGRKGNATSLVARLPLATIPEETLISKLEGARIDAQEAALILDARAKQLKTLRMQLENGSLDVLCVHESDEAIERGEVFYDIPPSLAPDPIPYTAGEYADHLSHILQLGKDLPNYRFYPLPMSPFKNIKIHCKDNDRSIVEKLSEPAVAFSFNNPHMRRGISLFLDNLRDRAQAVEANGKAPV